MGGILARTYADSTNNLRSTTTIDSNSNGINNDADANVAMYTLVGNGCPATTTSSTATKGTKTTSSPSVDFASTITDIEVVPF
jgi:hypothetical protein